MRISSSDRRRAEGSTYLTVFWITSLVALILAAYLKMVSGQNSFTMRSQAWNQSIAVVEAGIEEGLAHLNKNGTTNNNLLVDGWINVDGSYYKHGSVGDAYYDVFIFFHTNRPQITCRGYVPESQNYAWERCAPLLAYVMHMGERTYVYRTVRVVTHPDGMFMKGLVARYTIDLNGNNVASDSFDSSDPRYSTNGMYSPALRRDNGDVATNSGLTNTANIVVVNANLRGRVATGPLGSVTIGPNGVVGSMEWHEAGHRGIEPGWFTDDMNVSFPPVQPPFTSGYYTPSAGIVGGTNYALVIGEGRWQSSSVSLGAQDQVLVNGRAVWRVTGNFSMSGQAQIVIAPNASLMLYVGQSSGNTSASLGGNGIVNGTGYATNFIFYGLPSTRTLSISGNGTFIGAVYAPDAALSMNGGGSTDTDFCGAAVCATATMNGHYNFHYDEVLGRFGPRRGYVIVSWNEL